MRIIFKVVLVSMSAVRTAEFSRVASTSEIPPGIMRKVTVDGQDVVLANIDGNYFAIGDVCTHQEGPLDEGILDNYEVECPWHGSRFDLRTGAVKEGPAGNPEPTYEVRIDGENILVRAKLDARNSQCNRSNPPHTLLRKFLSGVSSILAPSPTEKCTPSS